MKSFVRLIGIIAICGILCLVISGQVSAQVLGFGPPALLNSNGTMDTGDDQYPVVVTDGTGIWVAVWVSTENLGGTAGSDRDIFISRSADNGVTWSAPTLLNTNGTTDNGEDQAVALKSDKHGNWLAVWSSEENLNSTAGTDRDIICSHSINSGLTWSYPTLLNTNGTSDLRSDESPRITTDDNGNWVAVWYSEENLGGTAGTDDDIFFARSTDNGVTWSYPDLLNTNGTSDIGDDWAPQIETDNAGHWLTIWQSKENLGGTIGSDWDILAASSVNNGATWSAPILLNTDGNTDTSNGSDYWPRLSTDNSGNWVAVWQKTVDTIGYLDYDIFASVTSNNGISWSSPSLVNMDGISDIGDDGPSQVCNDFAGNWLVVWQSYDNLGGNIDADICIARSVDGGQTWTTQGLLNTTASEDLDEDAVPYLCTDGNGHWVSVWFSKEDLNGTAGIDWDIFVSTSENILSVEKWLQY